MDYGLVSFYNDVLIGLNSVGALFHQRLRFAIEYRVGCHDNIWDLHFLVAAWVRQGSASSLPETRPAAQSNF